MKNNTIKNPEEQGESRERKDIKTRFKPGQSGNPLGRPKGITLKETARKRFEDPKERKKFIERMIKEFPSLTWQMLEGRPSQQVDVGPTEGLKELTEFFRELAETKEDDKGESKSI